MYGFNGFIDNSMSFADCGCCRHPVEFNPCGYQSRVAGEIKEGTFSTTDIKNPPDSTTGGEVEDMFEVQAAERVILGGHQLLVKSSCACKRRVIETESTGITAK